MSPFRRPTVPFRVIRRFGPLELLALTFEPTFGVSEDCPGFLFSNLRAFTFESISVKVADRKNC